MDVSENRTVGRVVGLILSAGLVLGGACSRGGDSPEITEPGVPATPTLAAAGPGSGATAPDIGAQTPPLPTPSGTAIEVQAPGDRRGDVEANRELATRLGLAPPDPLLVSDLLTRADVRELTNFQGELLETSLAGIPPGPTYNAIRLQADRGYGFALQLWQLEEVRQLSAQFRRLRETYFDSQLDSAGVANEAFSADFQGIRHYAFLHRASKSIAVVTCADALCDPTQIRALSQRVANRL